eukprot:6009337-Amphidinium_carterae.1
MASDSSSRSNSKEQQQHFHERTTSSKSPFRIGCTRDLQCNMFTCYVITTSFQWCQSLSLSSA